MTAISWDGLLLGLSRHKPKNRIKTRSDGMYRPIAESANDNISRMFRPQTEHGGLRGVRRQPSIDMHAPWRREHEKKWLSQEPSKRDASKKQEKRTDRTLVRVDAASAVNDTPLATVYGLVVYCNTVLNNRITMLYIVHSSRCTDRTLMHAANSKRIVKMRNSKRRS